MFDTYSLAAFLGFLLLAILGAASYSVYILIHGLDLAPLFESRERLKEDIASCQRTISDLKAEIAARNIEVATAQRTIAEGEVEKKWLDDNRDIVATLKRQIDVEKDNLQKALDQFNEKNDELTKVKSELQEVSGKHLTLLEENEKLLKENNGMEEENEQLENRISELKKQIESAKKEATAIDSDLQQKKNELENIVKEIEQQKERLKNIRDDVSNENRKNQELQKERKILMGKFHEEEEKYHNLVSNCIKAEPINEEAKWCDLNRGVFTEDEVIKNRNTVDEKEWLAGFKANLKNSGIKFHDRVIDAFHTSLKVADFSPLVVLAGISGTGKSLLPRLYAKALGMNFLQIAVQPRWDNPQDMFGFYNYMDGRYKATELSRLLWQYDIYNNPAAKTKYNKLLPMSIILLDEMNLAKVEYYFSDMLSKLEVRRGVTDDNPASRRNAEVEIECGATQKVAAARRLYVGRNMLFVGTMNEDESTQTLSDKVIDRSNVLRFGKPGDLAALPDISKFEKIYAVPCVMAYDDWKGKWLSKSKDNAKNVTEAIKEINNQLEVIGRPFAYRVYGAIQEYIKNYPGEERFALADQIEMKVLPKLNGVDKESSSKVREAINRIGQIIDDKVQDDKLSRAFRMAKDNRDDAFFQWRGVTR